MECVLRVAKQFLYSCQNEKQIAVMTEINYGYKYITTFQTLLKVLHISTCLHLYLHLGYKLLQTIFRIQHGCYTFCSNPQMIQNSNKQTISPISIPVRIPSHGKTSPELVRTTSVLLRSVRNSTRSGENLVHLSIASTNPGYLSKWKSQRSSDATTLNQKGLLPQHQPVICLELDILWQIRGWSLEVIGGQISKGVLITADNTTQVQGHVLANQVWNVVLTEHLQPGASSSWHEV